MAIFSNSNNSNQNVKADSNTTIITSGASIKGEINLTCNVYIDGEFDGIIKSDKEIRVGKNGHVKGEIFTNKFVVQGFFEGNVNANRVEIKPDGKLSGSVETDEFVIEAKGIFEGNSTPKKETKQDS